MRRLGWAALLLVLTAGAIWLPSRFVENRISALLRQHLEPTGWVDVRARATLWGVVQGRVDALDVEARGVRLGELVAQRMRATLAGVELVRSPAGRWAVRTVRSGEASIEIGAQDLERLLAAKGVAQPQVTISASGVEASGTLRVGPVTGTLKLRGEFYTLSGRDLLFRVTALEVLETQVPPQVANAALSLMQLDISLGALPFPMNIDRIASEPGRVLVHARVEEASR
ncbi:MAG: DUF2993 domain-containing protein [Armatimonadetes bacterium]|nr:DUF2993 domain-containing protein [Armatimonadota bacterium]